MLNTVCDPYHSFDVKQQYCAPALAVSLISSLSSITFTVCITNNYTCTSITTAPQSQVYVPFFELHTLCPVLSPLRSAVCLNTVKCLMLISRSPTSSLWCCSGFLSISLRNLPCSFESQAFNLLWSTLEEKAQLSCGGRVSVKHHQCLHTKL